MMKSWSFPSFKCFFHNRPQLFLLLTVFPYQIIRNVHTITWIPLLFDNFKPFRTVQKLTQNWSGSAIILEGPDPVGVFDVWLQLEIIFYDITELCNTIFACWYWDIVKSQIVILRISIQGKQSLLGVIDLFCILGDIILDLVDSCVSFMQLYC